MLPKGVDDITPQCISKRITWPRYTIHKPPGYSSCPKLVVPVLQTLALTTTTVVVSVYEVCWCGVQRDQENRENISADNIEI